MASASWTAPFAHTDHFFVGDNRVDIVLDSGATSSLWWATKNEWLGLIDVAGLEVEALYGDFDRTPFDEHSNEYIFVTRRPRPDVIKCITLLRDEADSIGALADRSVRTQPLRLALCRVRNPGEIVAVELSWYADLANLHEERRRERDDHRRRTGRPRRRLAGRPLGCETRLSSARC